MTQKKHKPASHAPTKLKSIADTLTQYIHPPSMLCLNTVRSSTIQLGANPNKRRIATRAHITPPESTPQRKNVFTIDAEKFCHFTPLSFLSIQTSRTRAHNQHSRNSFDLPDSPRGRYTRSTGTTRPHIVIENLADLKTAKCFILRATFHPTIQMRIPTSTGPTTI